jgi:hypothetical protein
VESIPSSAAKATVLRRARYASCIACPGAAKGTNNPITAATSKRETTMNILWTFAVVFFVLWILGFAAFHVTSGFIHVLLMLALIAVVVRLVTGRRTA